MTSGLTYELFGSTVDVMVCLNVIISVSEERVRLLEVSVVLPVFQSD